MLGDAHKSCLNARFITRNQATMNSAEITYVIASSAALYLSALALGATPVSAAPTRPATESSAPGTSPLLSRGALFLDAAPERTIRSAPLGVRLRA